MFRENDRLAHEIADLTGECCVDLFAAYGVNLLSAKTAEFIVSDEVLLSGVIGFVGPTLRGTCLLVGNRSPIELSSPQKEHTRDWVGELTNQLVGRLKRKFLGFGLEVALTTPVVLSGLHLRPMPRGKLLPRVFSTESGSIMVWVEVECEPGFELGPAISDSTSAEGEVLMF
ncbi:MAG TPA: chemotaxis protein CheX [Polyangiaceae bacterium]|nr:chemotaxis protein CheX [Polyangiaceae bacterium]